MALTKSIFQVPTKDPVTNDRGLVSQHWEVFFRYVRSALSPLGIEQYAPIVNKQETPENIKGLSFSAESVSHVIVDYVIQRASLGILGDELVEAGAFHLVYKPRANTWSLIMIGTPGPDDAGVDLTVTASGQVQYESSDFPDGTAISRITFRARTLAGKNHRYSIAGGI